jgi:hypothetical protein
MSFQDRTKFQKFSEALAVMKKCTGWINHIILNEDKSFSIMSHINCEWCDYCDQRNAAYDNGIRYSDDDYPLVHEAKQDPHENQSDR